MKFKVVFILFNIVIVLSFLIIYFMPLVMLGWDYTRVFWTRNWGLPLLFMVILGALNGYFAFNWRLFKLLEREDWDGLIEHLEHRIYDKRIAITQHCRILINAYLVRSKLDSMQRLESTIRDKWPRKLRRLAVPLGVRHLLSNVSSEMKEYFSEFKDVRSRESGWIEWSYAFALLLSQEPAEARPYLEKIIDRDRSPVLLLLACYMLDGVEPGIGKEKARPLGQRYTPEKMAAEIERQRGNVQVVILSRLIEEASDWLFGRATPDEDLH